MIILIFSKSDYIVIHFHQTGTILFCFLQLIGETQNLVYMALILGGN
jgi:hypothetical protein